MTAGFDDAMAAIGAAGRTLASLTERERLRLHRLYLQANYSTASRLALDLAAYAGRSLGDVAGLIEVPPGWDPSRPDRPPIRGRNASRRTVSKSSRFPLPSTGLRGVTLARTPSGGTIAFALEDGVIDAIARFGEVSIHGAGAWAFLVLPGVLPDAVVTSLVGRPLEDAVDHPALRGRKYVVETGCIDGLFGNTVLRFRPGLVQVELPWRGELEQEVACRARSAITR